ncbi:exported hypothetical protein [Desulfamplus magnetovallimortis]|uniref:Peptidase C-terminal archaeal/bacterial domain-containing protein n=1 Tax=Desulfamplus magnetovallimortis TaxID=1246637 RepID=A0A1W1HA52_9BACT|nr:hypothetical protein [Desulfamplus magnetovallimortis]SLM29357.1 exported hypothetical protein [Desulfamplus magnetovallimortis]
MRLIRFFFIGIMLLAPCFLHANPNVEMAFPDVFEIDDSPADAVYFNHNAISYQMHTFHKSGDEDWISFSALKSDESIEIKTFDPGPDCETVIGLYDTDGETLMIPESRHSLSDGTHLVSWRPVSDGTYYVKIANKNESIYGRNAYYKLWIYKPVMSTVDGRIDGIVTDDYSKDRLEGVLLSTPFDEVRSQEKGFYYLKCPAGEISFIAYKIGYEKFKTVVDMGQDQRIQINIELTPSYEYISDYEVAQWALRGDDLYYCVDICDVNGNLILESVACGENLNAWSAQDFVNITLGLPDSAFSGLTFMWKVRSESGYGGDGYEGLITVP